MPRNLVSPFGIWRVSWALREIALQKESDSSVEAWPTSA
jgi:hypothetical protein